jgi:hypothetical protein
MSLIGACGTQDALKLHTGDHVGMCYKLIGFVLAWVKRGEPRGKNYGARMQFNDSILLIEIDGLGLTDPFTLFAFFSC